MIRASLKSATLVFAVLLTRPWPSAAQVPVGVPLFGSFSGGPETINNADLNIHWQVPIRQKAGLAPFYYILTYDSAIWYPAGTSGSQYWWTSPNGGWQTLTPLVMGSLTFNQTQGTCHDLSGNIYYFNLYSNFVFIDPGGAVHTAPSSLVISDKTDIDPNCKAGGSGGVSAAEALIKDDYGYTIYASIDTNDFDGTDYYPKATIYTRSGGVFIPTITSYEPNPQTPNFTDNNGNSISVGTSNGTTTFTDTLGTTALAFTLTSPTETTFNYTGGAGAATATVNYTSTYVQTNFGCTGIGEFGPQLWNLVSSITLADGSTYSFGYETTPGDNHSPHYVTGRLTSVTLPTGGTISYKYSGGSNGITCADGSAATLQRSTPDTGSQSWQYAHSENGSAWTTTVTDPQSNATTYYFQQARSSQNLYETERKIYQGSSSSGTLLEDVVTCYNNIPNPCTNASNGDVIALPITQRTALTTLGSLTAETNTNYDSTGYGLPVEVDEYNWGPTITRKTITAYDYNNSCGVTNTYVEAMPCSVTIENGSGGTVASTTYSYDANGNLLSTTSNGLTTSYNYNNNGTVATTTDVNGAQTTYSYTGTGGCNSAFPTSANLPLSLSTSATWDCNGGVVTKTIDANGNPTTYGYNDPLWRVTSITDPTGAQTVITYTPATIEGTLTFNGGSSSVDILANLDGLGRVAVKQQRQSPGSSSFDSVQTRYDALGRAYQVSPPYSASADGSYGGSAWNTTQYDALNRPTNVTDAGGGSVAYTYPPTVAGNDVLMAVGSAPNDANSTKKRQLEYDGLGRLTSVCEITGASGSGACSQNTSATGFFTSYTYDLLNDLTGVSQSGQSRSYSYDPLGRLTSEANPESGATTYAYDAPTSYCTNSSWNAFDPGNMIQKQDANGNVTCYLYDGLHRPAGSYVAAGPAQWGTTGCKSFMYDNTSGYDGFGLPAGVSVSNVVGRMAEAVTTDCAWPPSRSDIRTDEWFSYSARGDKTDVYQATPNSGGYYHVSEQYWPNGALNVLSGIGLPTLTYGADGEGRVSAISASSGGQNPVLGTTYAPGYGLVTGVTLGSQDTDAYTYDVMGRMNSYTYNIGSQSVSGGLTWNPNGTLAKLAITDPIYSTDQQTCNYLYDDLARAASVSCQLEPSGTPNWTQTFSFDPFGNIDKTGNNDGTSFLPTYTTSPPTNQYSSIPGVTGPYYDSNGNVLKDGFHIYTWDADGNPLTIDSIGLTFDAFDRTVEQNAGGSYTQLVYGADGTKLALMNGQTLNKGRVPYPGGGRIIYTSGPSIYRYWHPDWQGSVRVCSYANQTTCGDVAFAPYGEGYSENATPYSFTGQWAATEPDLYDFLYREYHPTQGRWLTPDPAGLAAVNPSNPQSWNRYAYALNIPTTLIDPLGLTTGCFWVEDDTGEHQICTYPGGNGGSGGGPCSKREILPGVHIFRGDCGPPPTPGAGGGGAAGGSGNGSAAANNIDRSRSCFGIFAQTAFQPFATVADTAKQYTGYVATAAIVLQQGGFSLSSIAQTVAANARTAIYVGAVSADQAEAATALVNTGASALSSASASVSSGLATAGELAPPAAVGLLVFFELKGLNAEINAAQNGECGGDK
ncbi:MAG: RHS repeat-associated core domain-containing protein [Terriglobia bacterium]|jgi:RHS repeat-associated protein